VFKDGCTYRTHKAQKRPQNVCQALGDPALAKGAFGENRAASIMAKEKNSWKPTPVNLLADIGRPALSMAIVCSGIR